MMFFVSPKGFGLLISFIIFELAISCTSPKGPDSPIKLNENIVKMYASFIKSNYSDSCNYCRYYLFIDKMLEHKTYVTMLSVNMQNKEIHKSFGSPYGFAKVNQQKVWIYCGLEKYTVRNEIGAMAMDSSVRKCCNAASLTVLDSLGTFIVKRRDFPVLFAPQPLDAKISFEPHLD